MIFVRAYGQPAPQGSKTIAKAGGKVWLRDANPNLAEWRNNVANEAWRVMQNEKYKPLRKIGSAVKVEMWFYMERPAKPKYDTPRTKPDIDKLIRAVLDALTGIVYDDDSQVIEIKASKTYADQYFKPGVGIQITEL